MSLRFLLPVATKKAFNWVRFIIYRCRWKGPREFSISINFRSSLRQLAKKTREISRHKMRELTWQHRSRSMRILHSQRTRAIDMQTYISFSLNPPSVPRGILWSNDWSNRLPQRIRSINTSLRECFPLHALLQRGGGWCRFHSLSRREHHWNNFPG